MADESSSTPEAEPDNGRGTGSVKSAALWAAASQYSQFALQFITSVIISRFFLKPEEIGLFSVALATAMILSLGSSLLAGPLGLFGFVPSSTCPSWALHVFAPVPVAQWFAWIH